MVLATALARLELGAEHHRAGRLDEAERIYREILAGDPSQPDALYLLGTIYYQRGAWSSAHLFLRKAISARPRHAETHNNLGLVLDRLNRTDEAREAFDRALAMDPNYADALYNRANLDRQAKDWGRAEKGYRRALERRPGWGEALDNLGLTLRMMGRFEEALLLCQKAAEAAPRLPGPWLNLGAMAKQRGDLSLAAEHFRHALSLDPTNASAATNLGVIYTLQREWNLAEPLARQAVLLDPQSAMAHNNLGLLLFLSGREEEASACFAQSVALDPAFADAFNNLGSALYRLNDVDGALDAYTRSLTLQESAVASKNLGSILEHVCRWEESASRFARASQLRENHPILRLRSHLVCPTLFDRAEQIDEYRANLAEALAEFEEDPPVGTVGDWLDADIRPSFAWQFQGRDDRPIRESLARLVAPSFPTEPLPLRREGLPTVGFLVAPGHEYAFVRSMGGMFPLFDRGDWRPCVVGARGSEAKLRQSMGDSLDFVAIPGDLDGIVDALRQEPIDLLYHWEIGTGAMNYLLPFGRPAPLQVTSWGIQVTSGIGEIDYYLSSKWVEPPDAQNVYTEKLVLLDTMLTYQRPMPIPERPLSRSAMGLPETGTLYLCAQQLGKFHPDFDPILRAILDQDPTGWLVTTQSSYESENCRLRHRWERTLAGVSDRVLFLPKQVGPAYASLVLAADVVLDPIHFGGVNTTYDALSAGRATVTWPSQLHRGRYTLGCFSRMGLMDTVARSADEYVALAGRLARDLDYRRAVESSISQRREVLFESKESASELQRWMMETIERARP
jgi:predicted O-linked N-acetylglucosamine transferase (SPINDLY family)